jgi:ribose transport system substrate-binding protein
MKPIRRLRPFVPALFLSAALAGCSKAPEKGAAGPAAAPEASAFEIAVIPKGTTHTFWKTIHAGAARAAQDLGVTIIWMGPEKEDDRKQQIEVVQNFISRGVDAIVLAPLDDTALVRPVETAVQRGIPVVVFDSDLKSGVISSFVATDNREGGRLGARRLAEVMGGKGNAILLRYNEGSASTQNREEGFLEEIAKHPDIALLSTDQYAGATKESAFQASQNLLNKYGDQVQGIFCPNESSAFGMMRALQTSDKGGSIRFVGFDASEGLVNGLKEGTLDGLVVQDPYQMGYRGVETAVAVLKGQPVEPRIPTRLAIVTPDNLNAPEMQDLIAPELK